MLVIYGYRRRKLLRNSLRGQSLCPPSLFLFLGEPFMATADCVREDSLLFRALLSNAYCNFLALFRVCSAESEDAASASMLATYA